MALTNTLILGPNVAGEVTANSVSTSDFYVKADQLDERTVFLYTPTSGAGTITVYPGNGYTSAANNLVLNCGSGKTIAFTLDSARFKIVGTVTGTADAQNVGSIKMKASAAGTFSIIQPKV